MERLNCYDLEMEIDGGGKMCGKFTSLAYPAQLIVDFLNPEGSAVKRLRFQERPECQFVEEFVLDSVKKRLKDCQTIIDNCSPRIKRRVVIQDLSIDMKVAQNYLEKGPEPFGLDREGYRKSLLILIRMLKEDCARIPAV